MTLDFEEWKKMYHINGLPARSREGIDFNSYRKMVAEEYFAIIDYEKGEAIRQAEMQTAMEEGIAIGEEKVVNQIALKLLKRGLPLEQIAQATELTIEQLQKLEQQ